MDQFYAVAIQRLIDIIGYEAAYNALMVDALERLDSTKRQALSMEGAFATEVAQIAQDYPNWDIRFEPSGDGFQFKARARETEQAETEVVELNRRINEAFEKYKKIPHDSIKLNSSITRIEVPIDVEEGTTD